MATKETSFIASRAQRHYERALSSWRLPGAIPTLSDSSASVAAPAVSQTPRSRLGSSDRLTLRDVVRLGTLNCRTLLSEVRQQELVRLMESRQIDVLALQEHRMVLLDPNEVPVRDLRGGYSRTHLPGGLPVLGDYKELMDLAQRRETWRRLAKSL